MNKRKKHLISRNNIFLKKNSNRKGRYYFSNKNHKLQDELEKEIELSKQRYYTKVSQKLSSLGTNPKCYWALLKRMLNKKKTIIPALVNNNEFVTDFKKKVKFQFSFF